MKLETERLILRPWQDSDAKSLYEYAKDPKVGPIAGWPPHKSEEDSLRVIQNVLMVPETYAICRKEDNIAIGSISLMGPGASHVGVKENEWEIGFWLGTPFWGRGYMPEAVKRLQKYAFEDLNCNTVWCGYYDGNTKSKRVQEKCGFIYHHTDNESEVRLLNETRVCHISCMTKEQWEENK